MQVAENSKIDSSSQYRTVGLIPIDKITSKNSNFPRQKRGKNNIQ